MIAEHRGTAEEKKETRFLTDNDEWLAMERERESVVQRSGEISISLHLVTGDGIRKRRHFFCPRLSA